MIDAKLLPKDVIDSWPEVFGDIQMMVIPLKYLKTILVNFVDGRTWEINLTAADVKRGWKSLEQTLSDFFEKYSKNIKNIDYKIDMDRVKKDVQKTTNKFLKQVKL